MYIFYVSSDDADGTILPGWYFEIDGLTDVPQGAYRSHDRAQRAAEVKQAIKDRKAEARIKRAVRS